MKWVAMIILIMAATGTARAQLQSALEVRSLSFEDADAGKPVVVTGTVIFPDPPATVFIQDETAGTFFRLNGISAPRPGDRVEVRGKAFPGLYLPGIEESTFRVIDHPGLPEPIPVSYEDLVSGKYHYQRVAVEGIVREIRQSDEAAGEAILAVGSHRLEARISQPLTEDLSDLAGSKVRVTGLAAGEINNFRQLVKPYLRCLSWREFEILVPSAPPGEIPLVTPKDLLTFQAKDRDKERVRMRGTVLAREGKTLFLRDDDSAIATDLTAENREIEIGNEVEIIGFPVMDHFSASIADATVIDLQPGETKPLPVSISWEELASGEWNANLVSLRGRLAHWYRTESETRLALQSNDGRRSTRVRVSDLLSGLKPGMELEVTGVCLVESTRHAQYRSMPDAISLRPRGKADIRIIGAPAWWTAERLAWALVILTAVIFLAAMWIFLLQRQVERQTAAIRSGIEQKAALEERQRIARDFHDTLEQDLAGLSLRLDAAIAQQGDGKIKNFLDGARGLVSRIQSETRNLVADLRENPKNLTDLESALEELSASSPGEVGPGIATVFDRSIPHLPSRTVHHLKMIAREAITNAVKHAEASHVKLSTGLKNNSLVLTIADDGTGFDVGKETRGKTGHFGCMGMRERARKLNADIEWQSDAEGTTVTVTMPLNR